MRNVGIRRVSPLIRIWRSPARSRHHPARAHHARQEETFWKSYLDGYSGVLDIPTTYPRTPGRARTAGEGGPERLLFYKP